MSQILLPGERPSVWNQLGDALRRIARLEAVDPCECFASLPTFEQILQETCVNHLWKLNESSGDVAEDSIGASDLTSGAYDPPTWSQEDSPAGDPSAFFDDNLGLSLAGVPAMTGDFSALILFNRADLLHGQMIGQGNPESANTSGWSLAVGAFNEGAFNRPKVYIGDTTGGPHGFEADAPVLTDDWTMVGFSRISNVWRLYVNGSQQSGSYNDGGTNYNGTTGIWIGNNPSDVGQTTNFHGLLAYGATFSCGLTEEDWTGLNDGLSGDFDGYVWTLVNGVAQWAPSTIEVELS